VSKLSIEDLNKKLAEIASQAEAILEQHIVLLNELKSLPSTNRNDGVVKHMLHPVEYNTSICGWFICSGNTGAILVPYGSPESNCESCQNRYYHDQLGAKLVWLYELDSKVSA